ncbi:DUF2336 domain-containing protein [Stappia sp. F7233]|uniref:DUF2336 domain-containing protein n=1 Tax=Stappia albiluteola TaxID=2758565 RepID=A0A839ACW2_9HYPH|nr:DUF2336 domain-containing protein [Stappia albiluteola]MBA5777590.1 DUF2336 domain-containing protein [Stappia albiluteola]
MIVQAFLRWVQTAPDHRRAEATNALARAWLYSEMGEADREAAEAAMTIQLDDPSPYVRSALAYALARSDQAPRHIILALVEDIPEIAAIVLEASPILLDAELVDFAASFDGPQQVAIAKRAEVSPAVAAAIAEVGSLESCLALIRNEAAEIAHFSMARMIERHGETATLRNALMGRADTPLNIRQMLVKQLGDMLAAHPLVRQGLRGQRAEQVVVEARERATLALAADATLQEAEALVEHLRVSEQLTAALLLRAVCSGNIRLFEAALARLAHMPLARVYDVVAHGRPSAVRALVAKAGLPPRTHRAFVIAVEVWRELEVDAVPGDPVTARRMVERILTRYQDFGQDELDDLLALLRRFATETARDAARAFVGRSLAA